VLERSKCSVTHSQIACGTCPHCGLLVAVDPNAPEAGTGTSGVRWNIARLLDDLDRDDEATRLTTIFNLSDQLPPLEEALPVVRKAFNDRAERVRDRALTASVRLTMSTEEHLLVETCVSLLRQAPADLAALHILLHFYVTAQVRSETYRNSRHELILQVIKDLPDAPHSLTIPMKLFPDGDGAIFEQAKSLWLKQIQEQPDNTRVLENASGFFQFVDDVVAGKLLRRCKELEPGNPRWSRELGGLYSFQGDPQQPESYKDWGLMSLAELETAWQAVTDPDQRFYTLMKLPAVALQSREIEKACNYAEKLLSAASEQQHPSVQIWADREANMVLGWSALDEHKFDEAKARLFSARTPVALYFTSCYCFMDPLMKLVGWMLDLGQHEAVLEYLRRDQELVPEFRDRLVGWAREIEQGVTPDFQDRGLLGENLKATEKFGNRPAT
jgi:tetratricopeptide (TPR) repeat protein